MAKNKSKNTHQLRIIAGEWRGQKIHVIDQEDLRPTTDRVRETLFNWLAPYIVNAECLDAFAGSGILSLEALSRDAKSAVMIEKSKLAMKALKCNVEKFNPQHIQMIESNVLDYLDQCKDQFDLIFLDPPFSQPQLLIDSLDRINKRNLLKNKGVIYIEMAKQNHHMLDSFDQDITWLKKKIAGQVCYALLTFSNKS